MLKTKYFSLIIQKAFMYTKNLTSPKIYKSWLALVIFFGVAGTLTLVQSQSAPPNIPATKLAANPLYAAVNGDKPTMALALSVEFPTTGAQYVAAPNATSDATYNNIVEYIGYYDAESCYKYNDTPSESPATGLTASDYKRFDRVSAATDRTCSDAFSGNFLNWSSSSAIDMIRMALSGGDRYIDTVDLTILQRAVLPNIAGNPKCFWNSNNFPAKQLQKNGGGTGSYWGAVPLAMRTQAKGSDIWIGNTLNKIYFGTKLTGSCSDTSAYDLGGPEYERSIGPVINRYSTRLNAIKAFGGTECAKEGKVCDFTGINEILYGSEGKSDANGGWISYPAWGGALCSALASGIDPAVGQDKKCYIRPYTGDWKPVARFKPLADDGFFYGRVQVCNSSSGILQDNRDFGLCTRYPNGAYKPTGAIQKYNDQMRFTAFGYALDQTNSFSGGRYGGVLRVPMKFVGPKTFDENGNENTPPTGNPEAEWNLTTGVFNTNPNKDTTQVKPISGVINYLNKFGRIGEIPGKYKQFDPISELYSETLRYLQGLQPSPEAISDLTTAMYDGFPIYTKWDDPYGQNRTSSGDYSCLKSNIVTIGDINNRADGSRLRTRKIDLANNVPDFTWGGWNLVVERFENNVVETYVDGQGVKRPIANPNTPFSFAQPAIVGQAYWAHTHDIRGKDWTAGNGPALQRPGLRVKSYFFDVNENGSSNDASFRQNQNKFFTAAKYGGFEADSSNIGGKPFNTFGNPFKRQDGTDDNNVWQDSARPGEASTYFMQSSARGVLTAFDSIFSRTVSTSRSIGGTVVANKNVTSAGTLSYQSSFDTAYWTGDVAAFPVVVGAGRNVSVDTRATWSASTRLNQLVEPALSRNIIVGRSGASSIPAATKFTWAAIDKSLKDYLNKASPSSATDALGEDRLNYLRGDKTKEGTFRTRESLLGDVVNSGVVYLGSPVAPAGASAGFAAFRTLNAARTPTVFVGANDGMLHAFDANTGDELFAYIPSSMGSKLSLLTGLPYNSNHQSFVDATPVVEEAKVGKSDTAADWKSVLVSGMGGGAPGVFALDVTSSTAFSSSKALWEFTKADDVDIGFVVGRPWIVKLRTSKPGTTPAAFRYFAAVASGVNNYITTDGLFSASGNPALFLLALDKDPGAAWTSTGVAANYYKIVLPSDKVLSATNPTGLVNFRPSINGNGETENIYMGDLHGKLWKIDFTKSSLAGPSDWNINKLSSYNKGTAALPVPYPLFTAKTATGEIQPITMAPLISTAPIANGLYTRVIGFGTGKYLEATDKTSTVKNTFYAIYDDSTSDADTSPAGSSVISGRGRLQAGVVNAVTNTVAVPAFSFGRPTTDTSKSVPPVKAGFYFELPDSGERMINPGAVNGNYLVVSSLTPASAGAVGSCTAAGGGGNTYAISIDSGTASYIKSTVGLLGDPIVMVISDTSSKTTSTGEATRVVGTTSLVIGSNGQGAGSTQDNLSRDKRISWRQISNYKDLYNAK